MPIELTEFFETFRTVSESDKKHLLRLMLTEFSPEQLSEALNTLPFETREFIYERL